MQSPKAKLCVGLIIQPGSNLLLPPASSPEGRILPFRDACVSSHKYSTLLFHQVGGVATCDFPQVINTRARGLGHDVRWPATMKINCQRKALPGSEMMRQLLSFETNTKTPLMARNRSALTGGGGRHWASLS